MEKIFIHFHDEDSEGFTRRLFERLVRRFGKGLIFIFEHGTPPYAGLLARSTR